MKKSTILFILFGFLLLFPSCKFQKQLGTDPYYSLGPKGAGPRHAFQTKVVAPKKLTYEFPPISKPSLHPIRKKKSAVRQKSHAKITQQAEQKFEPVQALSKKEAKKRIKAYKKDNGIAEAWEAIFKFVMVIFIIMAIAGFLGFVADLMTYSEEE